jgi:hypothetical protein
VLVKLQHKNFITQLSWVVAAAVIFAIPDFFTQSFPYPTNSTLFLETLGLQSNQIRDWIIDLLHLLSLIVVSVYANNIFVYHQLIRRNNFLPALFFIALYFSLYSPFFQIIKVLNIFLLLLFIQNALKNYDSQRTEHIIFSSAFFIGLAATLSYSNYIFLPLLWISFFIFHNYNWRNIINSLIAISVPLFYLATYLYWTDQLTAITLEYNTLLYGEFDLNFGRGIYKNISLFMISAVYIYSFLFFVSHANSMVIAARKKTTVVVWLSVFCIGLILFDHSYLSSIAFIIPLSLLLAQRVEQVKRKEKTINAFLIFGFLYFLFQRYYLVFYAQF